MTVSVTYAWNFQQNLDLSQGMQTSHADVTSLANGGFSGIGDHIGHIDGDIFNAGGAHVGGFGAVTANTLGAIGQLSNGNIVIASQDADSTVFRVVDSVTGSQVVATVDLGNAGGSNADVAALAGGRFWIADQIFDGIAITAIEFHIRNNDGSTTGIANPDFKVNSTLTDVGVSIAALDGGGVAVAWTRTAGGFGQEGVWYTVLDAAGGVIRSPALFDGAGSVNRNVSVSAVNGGGFVIAYEDNSWSADVDITLSRFTAAGDLIGSTDVSQNSDADANPYVTRLSNGMLAVGMQTLRGLDDDDFVQLIDPNSGALLATRTIVSSQSILDEVIDVAVTGFGLGQLAAFHTNVTDNDIQGEALQAVRTMTSDSAGDSMVGDDFVDILLGNGGADFLYGGNNNDELYGGAGVDYMSGGNGNDYMSGGSEKDTFFGGAGTDTIIGGAGDDDYYVQTGDASDIIVEYAGEGNDRILSAISYSLVASSEIETLSTDANVGTASINLTGSNLANTIIGNNGVNILDGRGGNDILYGLGGTDYFAFSVAPNSASNIDYIIGFVSVDDLIFLDDAVFSSLSPGTLSATYFRSANGAVAAVGAERIVHNPLTGDLHWDADGAGGVGPVRFANIGAGTVLFNYDFFVN